LVPCGCSGRRRSGVPHVPPSHDLSPSLVFFCVVFSTSVRSGEHFLMSRLFRLVFSEEYHIRSPRLQRRFSPPQRWVFNPPFPLRAQPNLTLRFRTRTSTCHIIPPRRISSVDHLITHNLVNVTDGSLCDSSSRGSFSTMTGLSGISCCVTPPPATRFAAKSGVSLLGSECRY